MKDSRQCANHFPGMSAVCRKGELARSLASLAAASSPSLFDFAPRSYCLPQELGLLQRALRAIRDRDGASRERSSPMFFIVKVK